MRTKNILEFIRMQKLAGILNENEEILNRILDKISTQGKDSLTPEEETYLNKYSKGEKNLEDPIYYVKLNLPKDINSNEIIDLEPEDEEEDPFYDIVVELTKLNPQLDSELFLNNQGIFEDVIDEVEGSGTKREILGSYFYWLFRNLIANHDKFSEKEMKIRDDKYHKYTEKFKQSALKGNWMIVPTVTDNVSNIINKKLIDPDHKDSNDIWKDLGLDENKKQIKKTELKQLIKEEIKKILKED